MDALNFIDGRHVPAQGGEWIENYQPATGAPYGKVASSDARDVQAAVAAAQEAFPAWSSLPAQERSRKLRALARLIERDKDRLARAESIDAGKPITLASTLEIPRAALNFEFFADAATQSATEAHPAGDVHLNYTLRQPLGPVGSISPWNLPLYLLSWKVAPALAAGNTVVAKPPEWAPLTASLLADIAAEAGLPDGVLNVVQGLGAEAGAPLAAHPRVRRISFTGSVPTGRKIGAAAAANVTPVSLELGGKSPLLVLDDADIDLAADLAVEQFDNAGQVCLAAVRILVQESIADRFRAAFLAKAEKLGRGQGDPRDETTTIGPLVASAHLERVDGFVRRAKADGARVVLGGEPNSELNTATGGFYYRPTVLERVDPTSEIVCREVFGPVLTLQTFRDEEEAIRLANSTRYGLSGIVYTGSRERAERVGRGVRAGTVWVNTFLVRDLTAPFGGVGISGIGREGGNYALDFYSELKALQILEGTVQ